MKTKRSFEKRIRGWLTQESHLPNRNSPIHRRSEAAALGMNKMFVLALIGGIIAILVTFVYIAVGLAYGGILRSLGFYVNEGAYGSARSNPRLTYL